MTNKPFHVQIPTIHPAHTIRDKTPSQPCLHKDLSCEECDRPIHGNDYACLSIGKQPVHVHTDCAQDVIDAMQE